MLGLHRCRFRVQGFRMKGLSSGSHEHMKLHGVHTKSWMVLEAKCYVYMISPLASNSAHVRLHAAEPRRMYDFRKYAQSVHPPIKVTLQPENKIGLRNGHVSEVETWDTQHLPYV